MHCQYCGEGDDGDHFLCFAKAHAVTTNKELIERNREAIYAAVKNADMDTYRKVCEIAHLADPAFGGRDLAERCARVESAMMYLVGKLLRLF